MLDRIAEFVKSNEPIAFAGGLIVVATMAGAVVWGWRVRPTHFPDRFEFETLFEECFASGRSHKSLFTRLAAAKNCLRVVVADGRLWVYPQFPFGFVARRFDLDHRIPLEQVDTVKRRGKRVSLEFVTGDGDRRTIELGLRKAEAFEKSLQQG